MIGEMWSSLLLRRPFSRYNAHFPRRGADKMLFIAGKHSSNTSRLDIDR